LSLLVPSGLLARRNPHEALIADHPTVLVQVDMRLMSGSQCRA